MNRKIVGKVEPAPEPEPRGRQEGPHPSPATLRAYADGELRWWQRRLCAGQLGECAICRIRLAEESDLDRRAAALLTAASPAVDTDDEWHRLGVLAGSGLASDEAEGPRLTARFASTAWSAGLDGRHRAARLAAAGIGLAAALAAVLVGIRSVGQPGAVKGEAKLQDLCCWDLDGGGPGDDGIVTVTLSGQQVVGVTVYEDRNGSGSLTEEDPIRFAAAPGSPSGAGNAGVSTDSGSLQDAAPLELRDVCCADYDRGGPADDGVMTVSRADVVVQVALYEDEDASRTFTAGDRVRWRSGTR
jgi:hypothetical protein